MRFNEKDFEIPQVCLDLGFEDRSYHNEQSARMYNPQLDLTRWVNEPSAGKKRYLLQECNRDATSGEVDTDDEMRELALPFAATPCYGKGREGDRGVEEK